MFFLIRIVFFCFFVVSTACAIERNVPSLSETLSLVFNDKHEVEGQSLGEAKGKLEAGFFLREMGTENQVSSGQYDYYVSEADSIKRLTIKIPIGHHYIDKSGELFNGSVLCVGGGASSGIETYAVSFDNAPENKYYMSNEWSCGSLGCSYLINFSDKKNNSNCK